ncbi:MAG: cellobiose phosphorylase, partial [Candidatus Omnitrophota bacterium]
MEERLWRFTDNFGSFESTNAHQIKTLYFPLCNENIMSSITPDLHGDIKRDEYSFLLEPVSRIDLANSRSSRNFWVRGKGWFWSAAGVSKDLRQIQGDKFRLEAGLLWHKVTRENKKIGLRAEILSFAPASGEPVEIMQVTIANISRRKINFAPTAAIPIYARSAANIRDHRHVTSLLQRVTLHQFGVVVKPTLSFDEKGHRPNKTNYFVLGWDEKFRAPQYIYPTQEMFCGEGGDLEAPESVLGNLPPSKERIQGKEAMGGLRFAQIKLAPGKSYSYIILLGISDSNAQIKEIISKFKGLRKIESSLKETRNFWINKSNQLGLACSDPNFNHWLRWVSIQPLLRKIYGCSYLPDFDYGKGGRGWRDLWQDCLSLILSDPKGAAAMLVNNFSGVRMDGSNATIIGKKPGEFISDRNDIARVWMDHGAWPLITLDLYIRKTADLGILFEDAPYFRDQHIFRSSAIDKNWRSEQRHSYRGSILEHLLVQNLVQFYNVGKHNYVRLEGGDWNDGLDMAKERGESVAFSCMYAANLKLLAQLLRKAGRRKVEIARELQVLLQKINYNSVSAKRKALSKYFSLVQPRISGKKVLFDAAGLVEHLEAMSGWMSRHIRKTEWL